LYKQDIRPRERKNEDMALHISESEVRAVLTSHAIEAVEEISRKQASGEVVVQEILIPSTIKSSIDYYFSQTSEGYMMLSPLYFPCSTLSDQINLLQYER